MCRLAAYIGEPLFLEELIAKPRHSLMRQSLRAEGAKAVTNGDGFGIGWYGERDEPGVYREVMPAWSDDNLLALSQALRSRLFFAHVRATTCGGISRQNCHPFRHGRHLFMHNGQIGGYGSLRRTLESWLPDELYAALRLKGVPVEYVTYPREEHGLRERAHRLDALTRLLAFFERHLRPAP